jgi:hypothetical protein
MTAGQRAKELIAALRQAQDERRVVAGVEGLAGDAVAVAVHLRPITGVPLMERCLAGGADLVAAGIIDATAR